MSLYVQETYVDETREAIFGESSAQEAFTDNVGELFRSCQREYGRCVSRVYVDRLDGTSVAIGWVFSKKMQYEDAKKFYVRSVWVTLYEEPPRTELVPGKYRVIGNG